MAVPPHPAGSPPPRGGKSNIKWWGGGKRQKALLPFFFSPCSLNPHKVSSSQWVFSDRGVDSRFLLSVGPRQCADRAPGNHSLFMVTSGFPVWERKTPRWRTERTDEAPTCPVFPGVGARGMATFDVSSVVL